MDLLANVLNDLNLRIQLIDNLRSRVDVIVRSGRVIGEIGGGIQKRERIRIDACGGNHILAGGILWKGRPRQRILNHVGEDSVPLIRGWRNSRLGATYALFHPLLTDEEKCL